MYSASRILRAFWWLMFGKSWQRRRVRHECARFAASLFGDYPVSDDYKLWREDKEFIGQYKNLCPGNYFTQDRKFTLREFIRTTKDIPGALVECGCWEGASAWFIANEFPESTFYIFDSFEGLSCPGKEDKSNLLDHQPWKQGDMAVTEQRLRSTLNEFKNIRILKGWIPNRFEEVAQERFRFVHIDVDLYKPTYASLEFFYPRMNPGGIIVLDDYGSTICPGAYKAAEEFMIDKPEYIINLPTSQGIIIKK